MLELSEGELRPDIDLELLFDAIYGPIYFRLLVAHAPLSKEFIEEHLELILQGARPSAS